MENQIQLPRQPFHNSPPGRFSLWPFLTLLLCSIFVSVGHANNYAELDRHFSNYEQTLDRFVRALDARQWPEVLSLTQSLTQQSQQLLHIGRQANNPSWTYYSSNLYHHCLEMEQAATQKNGVESIYLFSTLLNHLDQIQSSDPFWLRHHIRRQLEILEQGIAAKNLDAVRDAAEIIHTSANKIILSISSSPKTYQHTYWKNNIIVINRLGDTIIGETNQGDWSKVAENLFHIQHVLEKWFDSFNDLKE
ncbi:MAG TPA: hypothetical protein HPQ00_01390 [Magnetococcales bacterium]|nr:hypothetical protein [Magnetococcales bacterium]